MFSRFSFLLSLWHATKSASRLSNIYDSYASVWLAPKWNSYSLLCPQEQIRTASYSHRAQSPFMGERLTLDFAFWMLRSFPFFEMLLLFFFSACSCPDHLRPDGMIDRDTSKCVKPCQTQTVRTIADVMIMIMMMIIIIQRCFSPTKCPSHLPRICLSRHDLCCMAASFRRGEGAVSESRKMTCSHIPRVFCDWNIHLVKL